MEHLAAGELLTLARLAARLPLVNGRPIARATILRLIAAGDLRAVKLGRRTLVPLAEVENLVRQLGCGRAG